MGRGSCTLPGCYSGDNLEGVSESNVIRVSAVVLRNDAGEFLTVRKHGASKFQLPGGKPEAGETSRAAAVRECNEELGVELDQEALAPVGAFTAPAANEPGYQVEGVIFAHAAPAAMQPLSEITELRWQDPYADPLPADLAPLLAEQIIPALTRPSAHPLPNAITVFMGSADGNDPEFAKAAVELGQGLASCGITLVYGGGHVGLMGRVADSVLAAGGEVTGVIPKVLMDDEVGHPGLTNLEVVPDMRVRKQRMDDLGDAFVAMPGGPGTLEEFFETWTWQQLGIHSKPVALYNVGGFWDPLLALIDQLISAGFVTQTYRDALIVATTTQELFDAMRSWQAPPPKWQRKA